MKLAFSLTDTVLVIDINSPHRVNILFSKHLQRFLSLKVTDIFQSPYHAHFVQELKYIKPTLPKEQYILWTSDTQEEDLWLQLNDLKISIPKTSNTIEKFASTLATITNGTPYENVVTFAFSYRNYTEKYTYVLSYKLHADGKPLTLR